MEDDDGCLLSETGLNNRCDKPANQVFHLPLKTKIEDAKASKELLMDEDLYKVSGCYNNVTGTKNSSVKVSRQKVKLNGNLGSSVKTTKCDSVIISNESLDSVSKEDRTRHVISASVQVNDEQGNTTRKRKACGSPDSGGTQHNSSVFENMQNTSFKKRKISRVSIPTQSVIPQAEARASKSVEDSSIVRKIAAKPSESRGSAVLDNIEPDTHLTGFAQYLGLQPIVKFRCFKCEETGFPTLNKLQEHQNACLKNLKVPLIPKPSQPNVTVDPSLSSTNFRISRKVFLCGSCGTYYENWNLFLHMREVHKRLICLYCLTMFSQIDMLSAHLTTKHGIVETVHASAEDLLSDCKGSCFLMCCDCDAIFTERDDFANHVCPEKSSVPTACQLCGMRNTHYPTCPRAGASSSSTSTSSCSFSQAVDSKPNSQTTTLERGGASVTKYLIPVSSVQVPHRNTTKSRVTEDNQESDVDDDYDISNAASFCHVNIHEPPEKMSSVNNNVKTTGTVYSKSTQATNSEKRNVSNKLSTISLRTDIMSEGTRSLDKTDFVNKSINNQHTPPDVGDSTLDNKLFEQKSDLTSRLHTGTVTEALGDTTQVEDRGDNEVSEECSNAELNQPSPPAAHPGISSTTTEVTTDEHVPHDKSSSPSTHVASSFDEFEVNKGTVLSESEPESSSNPDEIDELPNKLTMDVNISTHTDEVGVEPVMETSETDVKLPTSEVTDVQLAAKLDGENAESSDTSDSVSPLETNDTDSKSQLKVDETEFKSPVEIDETDTEPPIRALEVDGKVADGTKVATALVADDTVVDGQSPEPEKADATDSQSPTRTNSFDSMSPLPYDTAETKSPEEENMTDFNKSLTVGGLDSQSPVVEESNITSPKIEVIDTKLPEMLGSFEGKSSPPKTDPLDSNCATEDQVFDDTSELTNSKKSPTRITLRGISSPEKTDVVDSKSPTAGDWSDGAKSPLMTELEDSSTSSLKIELNNSPESLPSNEPSKSPVECNDSKSPLSGELLNSLPRTSPIIAKSPSPELDSSKSPLRAASSRSSSRASSIENGSISPSPIECPNTENSTDTSYLGPPALTESEGNLQPSVFEESFMTAAQPSPTSPVEVESYTSSCTENGSKSNTDIGIKLQISSGTPVIIPKTIPNEVPAKKKGKAKLKLSPNKEISDINTFSKEEDSGMFPTLEKHKENVGTNNKHVNTKSKRKRPSRGGRRINRKTARTGKKVTANVSASENNVEDDSNLKAEEPLEYIQLAGDDSVPMELHLEDDLDALTIQVVMQESVKITCYTCVYCNHAKKIAVNGKQLALHLLAEHKFIPVYTKCESTDFSADELPSKKLHELSDEEATAEETEKSRLEKKALMDKYVQKLKTSLPNLQDLFLNTDTYDSSDRTFSRPYDRTYECFHCHYLTVLHKELYVHNRKMHQKTILLCIMCKSNFYSYSELLCHLCPGIYVPESSIKFRCHICTIDSLPSTFRLMVHLRKRHSVCDVCLETTEDQQKLSTHVWKHKLHHLCYRCGIAYRNKPDITKHLFWKHGTESVLCKKCLQKKWPHVYHFCIPPNAFICEECSASFTRAVALKVHKRLHTGDFPHGCDECDQRFISKRLLEKHQDKHREVPELQPDEPNVTSEESTLNVAKDEQSEVENTITDLTSNENNLTNHLEGQSSGGEVLAEEPMTVSPTTLTSLGQKASKQTEKKVDVYDLPPLNLSSDSDDSEGEQTMNITACALEAESTKLESVLPQVEEDTQQPVPVVDGIWDNFQNYKANLERRESQNSENPIPVLPSTVAGPSVLTNVMLDHDYCVTDGEKDEPVGGAAVQIPSTSLSLCPPEQRSGSTAVSDKIENDKNNGFDHDYCFNKSGGLEKGDEKKEKSDVTLCLESSSVNADSSIKKQKSQKKKKRSASSSSSDSSSSSGSTSCSCGDNCSCSSSSSSSGSSSDSSDSDRSTSETRRRQIARKERRDKVRRKKEEEGAPAQETPATNIAQEQHDDVNQVCPPEPEEKDVPILESDLDTDETETDEDFYDQHPQLLANKLMAEKRNQLLLLADVAPVNNVTPQPEPSNLAPPPETVSPQRKKVKSKKRKKRQHDAEKGSDNKLKLNLSTSYYNYQPSNSDFYKPVIESHAFNPIQNFSQTSRLPPAPSISSALESVGVSSAAESGSETDSKRLSKRRRMPKKFYGDSSDEDSSSHTKWSRKPSAVSNLVPVPCPPPTPPTTYKSINPPPEVSRIGIHSAPVATSEPEKSEEEDGAETESEQGDIKKSSSDSSSDSDKEMEIHTDSDIEPPLVVETGPVQQVVKKSENVYCYCQCPYDEVSEMIACDGKDCKIEWFHFECVGIMVPPKGKWFCPDCKKKMPTKNQHLS